MALLIELDVDDKGTAKLIRFEDTAKSVVKNSADEADNAGGRFDKLKGIVGKVSKGFSIFTKVLKTVGKGFLVVAGFVGAAVFALDRLFKSVIEVSAVKTGFEQMSAAVGGSVRVLTDAKNATKGLVTELDLMRQFNNAVALGVVDSSQQFANLTGAALTLGRALGVGPQRAIDSLVIGIGRQSRLMLDNLGIIVSVETATKKYSSSIT